MRQTVRPNRPGRFSGSLHNIRPSQPEALQVFAQAVAVIGGGAFQPRNVKQGAAGGSLDGNTPFEILQAYFSQPVV